MRRIFVFGLSLAAVFSLMYGGFKDVIPMLFTGQKPVLELIGQLIGWTIFAPIPAAVCYIWDGIFIGATATRGLRNAMLICAFLIYLPLHYFLTAVWQVDGMWCALLCFMIARGISLTLLSPKYLGISLRHLLKKAS
jgi:MATE family multidrug resistance protein